MNGAAIPSSTQTVQEDLGRYIASEFLQDPSAAVGPEDPLLEWGVLNSMNIARLLVHIREQFGVEVPPADIVGRNFKNLAAIAATVTALVGDETHGRV